MDAAASQLRVHLWWLQAALLLQYKFAMPPGAQRPTYEPSVLLMVKGGLPMLITRRQPADAAEEGA